ncbi:ABC transporter permease subunit [Saccharopolyspora sp. NFXS83]|uniref:ABC transporter permease n=1 Tax=Saccharopolyspora sp. NFXS83 TaxID=2993560 RepID=UPI00224B33D9|nr:ABC transporter permease subunit [Saccharopolyspora sp. NFXS83]MCX2733847.1 ABC transporter permease subunit [Saccharopolyspora sp. NFXS83]
MSRVLGWVLLGVPLLAALAGPLSAGPVRAASIPLLPPGGAHPLGTDVLGRDVLGLALHGGGSVLALAGGALALSYLAGVPLALAAVGQPYRWADRWLTRGLDLVLALPGLLVLMVLAATGTRTAGALVVAVAVLQLPAVVRIVRGAALDAGRRGAVEAMALQGESWWRIHFGYIGRGVLAPVAVDAGGRLSLVLYLVASANFLGLGLDPATADWAVLVERNQEALFLQPCAVLVPAALLVALCTGINLTVDHHLATGRGPRTRTS